MSVTFQEKLEKLRKTHPSQLTAEDRAEIHALRSYFQPHELKSFGIVTEEQSAKKVPATKTKTEAAE